MKAYTFLFTVAYATDDVTYIWRHENPVEMPKDMRLSQFDLMETPFNYSSTSFLKGGESVMPVQLKFLGDTSTTIFGTEMYSKTRVKRPLKNRQTKIFMTNGSLMKIDSFAECSPWSILQYF